MSLDVPTPVTSIPSPIAHSVDDVLLKLLDEQSTNWSHTDSAVETAFEVLTSFVLAGGKRLRPTLAYWAFVGVGGDPSDSHIVQLGAALEMLHTCALIHDDVMDNSDWRRSQPSVHKRFMALYKDIDWQGGIQHASEALAIVVGDLAFVYADILLNQASTAVREVFNEMRVELCVGQYLDLLLATKPNITLEKAERVAQLKSGKYSVERPLHMGALLGGCDQAALTNFSAFGVPLGEAFQIRDDLLGVFGDTERTGKPVGPDLREGKRTSLITFALVHANDKQRKVLSGLGNASMSESDVRDVQEVLKETGAKSAMETRCDDLLQESLAALDTLTVSDEARDALRDIAHFLVTRDH